MLFFVCGAVSKRSTYILTCSLQQVCWASFVFLGWTWWNALGYPESLSTCSKHNESSVWYILPFINLTSGTDAVDSLRPSLWSQTTKLSLSLFITSDSVHADQGQGYYRVVFWNKQVCLRRAMVHTSSSPYNVNFQRKFLTHALRLFGTVAPPSVSTCFELNMSIKHKLWIYTGVLCYIITNNANIRHYTMP